MLNLISYNHKNVTESTIKSGYQFHTINEVMAVVLENWLIEKCTIV